ncbi:MAG: acetate kinase [Clostridiaceae bacterium]|jgi:acetate kinase|nr:acetate kinase [Clostridiaceae bacterium]
MKILVINTGSSSLKYQLIDMKNEKVLAKGLCDRIGLGGSFIKQTTNNGGELKKETELKNHNEAITKTISLLTDSGVIRSMDEITAVGHRVVHGGEKFCKSALIDEEVIKAIEECIILAPLHNGPNMIGIKACREILPNVPMVAVFDTAFHQTMPEKAYIYALPYSFYEEKGIRRYGFHGTSHKYVAQRAAAFLNKPFDTLKIVTCHLGNGSSICAVKNGAAVDTSMGYTPLEGVAMGTRCGSIDPAIVTGLIEHDNYDAAMLNELLNKKSGVLGISGISSDFRDLDEAAKGGCDRAELALNVFSYQVKKYIGAYAAAMGGLDVLVFTAGIGENNGDVRKRIVEDLEFLGVEIDYEKNNARGIEIDISKPNAKVRTLIIPTNEELAIARETVSLLNNSKKQ